MKNSKKDAIREIHKFIRTAARMNYDGELIGDKEFDMVSDDAVETLNALIKEARYLIDTGRLL